MDAGLAQDGLHLGGQGRGNETPGFQQVIEAGDLQGGGAVRQVVQRIAQGLAALAVGPADPEAAVVLRIVEAEAGRLQLVGEVAHPHTLQHLAGGAVGGNADHAGEGVAGGRVELHVAGFDAGEGAEKNGDLGQARRIDHVVRIDGGETGVLGIGDVGERHRQVLGAHCLAETEAFQFALQLGLHARIDGLFEFRVGRAGVSGSPQEGQCKGGDEFS